jgi:hypothetical protein
MSHRRFRFSLEFLLTLTAVVAGFLGYANYRRDVLVRGAHELLYAGAYVGDKDHNVYRPSGFWPARPLSAFIIFNFCGPNKLDVAGRVYAVAEAKARYRELQDGVRSLGIQEFPIYLMHCRECGDYDLLSSEAEFDKYVNESSLPETVRRVVRRAVMECCLEAP